MTNEESNALKLAICSAWVVANSCSPGIAPMRDPSDDDVAGHMRWRERRASEIESELLCNIGNEDAALLRVELRHLRMLGVTPNALAEWRAYEATYGGRVTYSHAEGFMRVRC